MDMDRFCQFVDVQSSETARTPFPAIYPPEIPRNHPKKNLQENPAGIKKQNRPERCRHQRDCGELTVYRRIFTAFIWADTIQMIIGKRIRGF